MEKIWDLDDRDQLIEQVSMVCKEETYKPETIEEDSISNEQQNETNLRSYL